MNKMLKEKIGQVEVQIEEEKHVQNSNVVSPLVKNDSRNDESPTNIPILTRMKIRQIRQTRQIRIVAMS